MKALGGGDLKLLIAIGACLGPRAGFQLQAYAYAFGSVYALVKVVFQGALWKTLYAGAASVLNPLLPRAYRRQTPLEGLTMCFGPAICLAAAALAVARWVLP
jgi:Flp pilus assembly protein protease CpaA